MADKIQVEFIPGDHWYSRSKWKLLDKYVSNNGTVVVPEGYVTDGASIPFFARHWFSPVGRYFGAAIVHDWILHDSGDWNYANDQFDKEMRALHIPSWRRYIIMWSVRAYGSVKTFFRK